jgi:hypothetical protein
MEVIALGSTVAVGVSDGVAVGVAGVAVGVMGVGEDVTEGEGVSVAPGVGLNGGIKSTFLSIDLVDCAPFRFVVRISTWTG